MTFEGKCTDQRAGSARARFAVAFPFLLVSATVIFFVTVYPDESTQKVLKFFSLFKKQAPAGSVSTALAPPLDPTAFNGKRALDETANFIAVGPRCSGTEGAKNAAKYIESRLKALGADPVIDEFRDITPEGEKVFMNVYSEIKGSKDLFIIIISHYDTKQGISADFTGANDSGSSTGLLLELAGILVKSRLAGPTILLAFVDGEECLKDYGPSDGLHGSRYLASTLVRNARVQKTVAAIVVDMVGDADLNIAIPRNSSPELASLVFMSATEENARLKFSLGDSTVLDDHEPFRQAGIRAIDIIDFDYGSERGKQDYWHTGKDTIDKLSADSLQLAGRVLVRTLNMLRDYEPEVLTKRNPSR